MPYVERGNDGLVKGAYANAQPGYAEEFLPDDDEAVVAFMAEINPTYRVVTAAQAKVALFNADLYDAVIRAVAQTGYEPIRIYFESAAEWHSDHPYLRGLAAELELTDEQVIGLFEAAKLL